MSVEINKSIFRSIIGRCENQGYKGKKRDAICIEMLAGALSALCAAGMESEYQHLERVAYMLIAPRGYNEIVRLAGESTQQEQVA